MRDINDSECWVSEKFTVRPVRGLMVFLHGAHFCGNFGPARTHELEMARMGWLVARPLCGPWSFMNDDTVKFVDDVVAWLRSKYGLGESVPLLVAGGSMGGSGALIYTVFSSCKVAGCISLEPVTDFEDQLSRGGLFRRIAEVAYGYDTYRERAMARSPDRLLDRYPKIPYLIAHGPNDPIINGGRTRALAQSMKAQGLDVDYAEYGCFGHQEEYPLDLINRMVGFAASIMGEQRVSEA